jgi:alpha-galactosidase
MGIAGKCRARDLWTHKDLGEVADSYTAEVPSHGVILLKLK